MVCHYPTSHCPHLTGILSNLQARNLETSLNDKLAATGRTVTPGDLYAVTVRRGKYQDGVPYQAGQKIQPAADGSVTHILEAFGVSAGGETNNFKRVTDAELRKMEHGAAEGENVAEVAGDGEGDGEYSSEILGGAYKDVPSNGGHVHHMPADSVSPYSKSDGPGIQMSINDHMQTESWGSSKEAKRYRAKQKELIEKGLFREAQQMDIDNVHDLFGSKYDRGIKQMLEYTKKLLEEGIEK